MSGPAKAETRSLHFNATEPLVHVAGYNLGLVMRLLVGAGTPREFLARASAHLLSLATADGAVLAILVVATEAEATILVVSFEP